MQDALLTSSSKNYVFFPANSIIYPAISTIACSAVLISFCMGKSLKGAPLNIMILAINLADLVFSFVKASASIINPIDGVHCKILLALTRGSIISSVLWGAFFGHALYVVSKNHTADILSKYMKYYFIFGVFLPATIAFGLSLTDYVIYSPENNGICIHQVVDGRTDYESIIFFVIPLCIGCLLSILWYFMAALRIKTLFSEEDKGNLALLIIYPGITLICWVPMIVVHINRLLDHVPNQTLVGWARALAQFQGFFDAIVYGGSIAAVRNTCKRACKPKPTRKRSLRRPLRTTETESSDTSVNTVNEPQLLTRKSLQPIKPRIITF